MIFLEQRKIFYNNKFSVNLVKRLLQSAELAVYVYFLLMDTESPRCLC